MADTANMPIGVFDSGIGGLTVAREIMRNLPNERIVYFGDTARLPYGNRSRATVVHYSMQILRFLLTQNIKTIVIACNTASAMAIDEITARAGRPVIGVVEPGARMAVRATKNKRVGVMATKSTIVSGAYTREIQKIDPEIEVIGEACPLLVPLVEEGWAKDPITKEILVRYLDTLLSQNVDTIILGCTHYPLLRSVVRELVGDSVTLVNPAYETAQELKNVLTAQELLNRQEMDPGASYPYRFFVSDEAERFNDFARSILPVDVRSATTIEIEKY